MPPNNKVKAEFIEPKLLRKEKLPGGGQGLYEIKLAGYRAIAFESGGKIQLRSRNYNDFGLRYGAVVKALASLPNDSEVVALDA
jgi:bifunctional non-homologous end joining protein LigD